MTKGINNDLKIKYQKFQNKNFKIEHFIYWCNCSHQAKKLKSTHLEFVVLNVDSNVEPINDGYL